MFPGNPFLSLMYAVELGMTPEIKGKLVEFYQDEIRTPGVAVEYEIINPLGNRVDNNSSYNVFTTPNEETGGLPEYVILKLPTRSDVLTEQAIESFIPIMGPIMGLDKKLQVEDYKGAAFDLGLGILMKGAEGAGELLVDAKKFSGLGEGLIYGSKYSERAKDGRDVFNNLANLAVGEITLEATRSVLSDNFQKLKVPQDDLFMTNPQIVQEGKNLFAAHNDKASIAVDYDHEGRIEALEIPIGEPHGVLEGYGPTQTVNLYGLNMSGPEIYRLSQEIGKEVFNLYRNNWQPTGAKYENYILETINNHGN
jgi:hypothetical protein